MNNHRSDSMASALIWGVGVPTFLWAIVVVGLIVIVPRYKKTFADFAVALPESTTATIAVSDWASTYWYILLLSLPFLLAPVVVILVLLRQWGRPRLSRLWIGLMIALPLVAGILVAIAIYLPLAKLNEGLSK
jgi:type II secretory pathway component PulF